MILIPLIVCLGDSMLEKDFLVCPHDWMMVSPQTKSSRLELQGDIQVNADIHDAKFNNFLKYGNRRDYNEWSLSRSHGDTKLFSKKLNCSSTISANFSSNLTVNLPKDLNQSRLEQRIPEEKKYFNYSHNLIIIIKAPFVVLTAFPDNPNPMSSSYYSSESPPSISYDLTHHTSSSCSHFINQNLSKRTQLPPKLK